MGSRKLIWLVGTLALVTLSGIASATVVWYRMYSTADVVDGLQKYAAQLHRARPAAKVRPLPLSENAEEVKRFADAWQLRSGRRFSGLLVSDGKLVLESYRDDIKPQMLMNGWSVAKSWTALAVGEALCAGKIKSLADPAQQYAPQLQGTAYGRASIRDLLRYASGAQVPADIYSGIHKTVDYWAMVEHKKSLVDLMKESGGARYEPGEKYGYNGLNSEALSVVIRHATGMSMPAWFEATVWQEAGGEFEAVWFLDKDGNGIAENLVFATSRDYLRVALYVLDRLTDQAGNDCIRGFLKEAAKPQIENWYKGFWWDFPDYGMGLHLGRDDTVWMMGQPGQRVGIHAKTRRVFVTNGSQETNQINSEVFGMLLLP